MPDSLWILHQANGWNCSEGSGSNTINGRIVELREGEDAKVNGCGVERCIRGLLRQSAGSSGARIMGGMAWSAECTE